MAQLATAFKELGGLLDMYLDPVTLDYVDTDDGEWLETADSRTLVLIMLELRFGEDWSAPGDGTRIKASLENEDGDPTTTAFIVAETQRAMAVLAGDGIVSDVVVVGTDTRGRPLLDESGRQVIKLSWRDLASGSPIDLVFTPFKG
jgi:hypothetical protein